MLKLSKSWPATGPEALDPVLRVILLLVLAAGFAGAFGFTTWKAAEIERRYPNIGTLTDVGGFRMNALHVPAGPEADLPPIVFIHGASGNLRDQEAPSWRRCADAPSFSS